MSSWEKSNLRKAFTALAPASAVAVSPIMVPPLLPVSDSCLPFAADTRTPNTLALGSALLQHQHAGILPSSTNVLPSLPLLDPMASTSMPESWVRGAILVRINSLIRGHSGVRWELIEKMVALLRANITPMVPLRGSISASGGTQIQSLSVECANGETMPRFVAPVVCCGHSHWEPVDQGLRRAGRIWRS
jgi:hypothetical protein